MIEFEVGGSLAELEAIAGDRIASVRLADASIAGVDHDLDATILLTALRVISAI